MLLNQMSLYDGQPQDNKFTIAHVNDALNILKVANYDLIILETSGIGQSDTEILEHSDILYVMTPEYGCYSVRKN